MAFTSNLRRQHRLILDKASKLDRLADSDVEKSATDVRNVVAELAGVLRVHLAMEDGVLFAGLREKSDPDLRAVAERFGDELQLLSGELDAFLARWKSPCEIAMAGPQFLSEWRAVAAALRRRINREEEEFFPLVDRYYAADPSARAR
ncbi:MAG: hemerythrin domain-containing protein [Deltaproteobacteria bacterium]|nr:hemerythrin domain-containing protein [Deltaproteobacteria bacterium]